jgi:hypothetical protein
MVQMTVGVLPAATMKVMMDTAMDPVKPVVMRVW